MRVAQHPEDNDSERSTMAAPKSGAKKGMRSIFSKASSQKSFPTSSSSSSTSTTTTSTDRNGTGAPERRGLERHNSMGGAPVGSMRKLSRRSSLELSGSSSSNTKKAASSRNLGGSSSKLASLEKEMEVKSSKSLRKQKSRRAGLLQRADSIDLGKPGGKKEADAAAAASMSKQPSGRNLLQRQDSITTKHSKLSRIPVNKEPKKAEEETAKQQEATATEVEEDTKVVESEETQEPTQPTPQEASSAADAAMTTTSSSNSSKHKKPRRKSLDAKQQGSNHNSMSDSNHSENSHSKRATRRKSLDAKGSSKMDGGGDSDHSHHSRHKKHHSSSSDHSHHKKQHSKSSTSADPSSSSTAADPNVPAPRKKLLKSRKLTSRRSFDDEGEESEVSTVSKSSKKHHHHKSGSKHKRSSKEKTEDGEPQGATPPVDDNLESKPQQEDAETSTPEDSGVVEFNFTAVPRPETGEEKEEEAEPTESANTEAPNAEKKEEQEEQTTTKTEDNSSSSQHDDKDDDDDDTQEQPPPPVKQERSFARRGLLERADSANLSKTLSSSSSSKKKSSLHSKKPKLKKSKSLSLSDIEDDDTSSEEDAATSTGRDPPGERPAAQPGNRRSFLQRADSMNLGRTMSTKKAPKKKKKQKKKASSSSKKKKSLFDDSNHSDDDDESSLSSVSSDGSIDIMEAGGGETTLESSAMFTLHSSFKNLAPIAHKKVHFDKKKIKHRNPNEAVPIEELWFMEPDFMEFRDNVQTEIGDLEHDKGYRQIVTATYMACCRVKEPLPEMDAKNSSSGGDGAENNNIKSFLSEPVERGFSACLAHPRAAVGVELIAVKMVESENAMRRRQVLGLTMKFQDEMGHLPEEVRNATLATGLERLTRPGNLFARTIGTAVAKAVGANDVDFGDAFQKHAPMSRKSSFKNLLPIDKTVRFGNYNYSGDDDNNNNGDDQLATVMGPAANSEALGNCWYTRGEHHRFRMESNQQVIRITTSEAELDCKYKGIMSGLYMACCRKGEENKGSSKSKKSFLPVKAAILLRECMNANSHGALGLELVALSSLREDTSQRRRSYIQKLLDVQQEHADLSGVDRAAKIRKEIEPISRPSRLFARELAMVVGED